MKKKTILQPTPLELYQCILITRTKSVCVWINHRSVVMKVRTMIVHKERSPLKSVDNLLSANVGPVVGHFGMSIDMTPPCLTTISNFYPWRSWLGRVRSCRSTYQSTPHGWTRLLDPPLAMILLPLGWGST
jgi:hypothetical protein